MKIWDFDSFGSWARVDLRLPTNLLQRLALARARRELSIPLTDAKALTVVQSLQRLNQHARFAAPSSDWRDTIYSLKGKCLRALFAHGYLACVTAEQQILKCHSCDRGIWERGTNHEEWCFKCHGTGIYKRVRLYKFTVEAQGQTFVFHQPDTLAPWANDLLERKFDEMPLKELPTFKEGNPPRVCLSNYDLQMNLLRVAYFVTHWTWFEELELCDWRAAIRHDLKEVANHLYRRVRAF